MVISCRRSVRCWPRWPARPAPSWKTSSLWRTSCARQRTRHCATLPPRCRRGNCFAWGAAFRNSRRRTPTQPSRRPASPGACIGHWLIFTVFVETESLQIQMQPYLANKPSSLSKMVYKIFKDDFTAWVEVYGYTFSLKTVSDIRYFIGLCIFGTKNFFSVSLLDEIPKFQRSAFRLRTYYLSSYLFS